MISREMFDPEFLEQAMSYLDELDRQRKDKIATNAMKEALSNEEPYGEASVRQ